MKRKSHLVVAAGAGHRHPNLAPLLSSVRTPIGNLAHDQMCKNYALSRPLTSVALVQTTLILPLITIALIVLVEWVPAIILTIVANAPILVGAEAHLIETAIHPVDPSQEIVVEGTDATPTRRLDVVLVRLDVVLVRLDVVLVRPGVVLVRLGVVLVRLAGVLAHLTVAPTLARTQIQTLAVLPARMVLLR